MNFVDLCDFVDLGRRSERADADRKHEIHGSRLSGQISRRQVPPLESMKFVARALSSQKRKA